MELPKLAFRILLTISGVIVNTALPIFLKRSAKPNLDELTTETPVAFSKTYLVNQLKMFQDVFQIFVGSSFTNSVCNETYYVEIFF